MRTTTTLTRRAAAVALAGALAFGVSACSDDDADDAATEVEEGVDDAESEVSEMATEMESEMEETEG